MPGPLSAACFSLTESLRKSPVFPGKKARFRPCFGTRFSPAESPVLPGIRPVPAPLSAACFSLTESPRKPPDFPGKKARFLPCFGTRFSCADSTWNSLFFRGKRPIAGPASALDFPLPNRRFCREFAPCRDPFLQLAFPLLNPPGKGPWAAPLSGLTAGIHRPTSSVPWRSGGGLEGSCPPGRRDRRHE